MKLLFFIILCATGATILYGYPAYKLHKAEKIARSGFKQTPNNVITHKFSRIGGQYAHAELLNQYPIFMIYIMFNQYEGKDIPKGTMEKLNEVSCEYLETLKYSDPIYRKSILNVTEKDRISFKYQIKNKFGDLLLAHHQVISECPNFSALKAYEAPKEQHQNPYNPPISPMKSAELDARERKLSNGY